MGFYCISPVAMFLANGELAHQWARTLAARKLRSSEVTRGLVQYVARLIVRAFTVV